MAITLTELQDKLKHIDEISLMEVLEITSEDMVARFADRIQEKYSQLVTEFDNPDVGGDEWWEANDRQGELDYD